MLFLSRGEIQNTESSGKHIKTGLKFETNKGTPLNRLERKLSKKNRNYLDIRTPQNYEIGELDNSDASDHKTIRSKSLRHGLKQRMSSKTNLLSNIKSNSFVDSLKRYVHYL